MIFLLISLGLSAVILLFLGHSRSSNWFISILLNMALLIVSFLLYFAKMGGLSGALSVCFFLTPQIQQKMQFMIIGSYKLSYLTVLGRAGVLFSLCGFVLNESDFISPRRKQILFYICSLICALLFLTFIPAVYNRLTALLSVHILKTLENVWRGITAFLLILLAAFLLHNLVSIPVSWLRCRAAFVYVSTFLLMLFFVVIGIFTPFQVGQMEHTYFMLSRIFFYNAKSIMIYWYVIFGVTILFTILAVIMLLSYLKMIQALGKPDVKLERKMLSGNLVVRVFSHGIKNQILANQVLLEELAEQLPKADTPLLLQADQIEIIRLLRKNNSHVLDRMNQLNDFFKQKSFVLEPLNLASFLQNFSTVDAEKNWKGIISLNASSPSFVLADAFLLGQTIENIIDNAIDATRHLESSAQINILLYQTHEQAIVQISDNGVGIPKKKLKQVFTPFFTSKNTKNNWGIGLAYAQKILKEHSGSIRIASTPGQGTCLYLLLPLYHQWTRIHTPFGR